MLAKAELGLTCRTHSRDFPLFLMSQYDVAVLMHGMKVARQFASTPTMRARLASDTEVPDSTIKHPPTSDDYLRCGKGHGWAGTVWLGRVLTKSLPG